MLQCATATKQFYSMTVYTASGFLNFDALKLKLDCTKAKKLMLRILTDLSKLNTH